MPKPSIVRSWDYFWERTRELGLHQLGSDSPEAPWVAAASALLNSGPLTRQQIQRVLELVEATVKQSKPQTTKLEEPAPRRWESGLASDHD